MVQDQVPVTTTVGKATLRINSVLTLMAGIAISIISVMMAMVTMVTVTMATKANPSTATEISHIKETEISIIKVVMGTSPIAVNRRCWGLVLVMVGKIGTKDKDSNVDIIKDSIALQDEETE